ncbi:hypothetical protein Lesp02_24160 [Lentzea sp. NBRC 105346]|uniref:hypothetical protein n=1 Tax=Lentzea sp. NBRC 105346 TaxID=3032205 RepID=UPI0024A599C6|nr:hypothetical protein [Lentzea sp. NBRC 105346]GLZ30226.1 hypothetical protein Lesp02_24160 [Lentzea sp. NBRC 105346]
MNFNDEVDWPAVFGAHISRPSLADPHNPKRRVYVTTMLFLEGGLREVEDQLSGRSRHSRDELAGARLTRGIVVKRAAQAAAELPYKVRVGDGGFKDRWPGLGGTANFFMCLVKYTCTAPRWSHFLDYGPRKALAELPKVRTGQIELGDMVARIAKHDLRMRTRLAKYWLFQLSLTIDAKWKDVATAAYQQLLDAYSERWVPVYEEGLRLLNVRFRPGMTAKKLSTMLSALTSGFAQHTAGTGDESAYGGEIFAESVQALLYAALDGGDGRSIAEALRRTLRD